MVMSSNRSGSFLCCSDHHWHLMGFYSFILSNEAIEMCYILVRGKMEYCMFVLQIRAYVANTVV